MEKMLVTRIFSFFRNVFYISVLKKNCTILATLIFRISLSGKGLTLYHPFPTFTDPEEDAV